ncbi:MAG: YajQ family cyclic di-GMP-binding protein [Elusimicrobia bacterium RIFOXYA2_FULL_39_19]|nr:MAG: YajQ family cyclic di-GMP-binding protein [Elusimicrobia bacterium RIFOXYA2_FULL_39_19]
MASDFSFDIVSNVDLQAVDDAVNTAMREISVRFDLKGSNSKIELNRTDKTVTLFSASDFQLKQIKQVMWSKLAKRGVDPKSLSVKKTETNLSGEARETNNIVCGIEKELAKEMVKDIKALNIKVQCAIQDEQIRVSGKSKDDLQTVISFVREKKYPIPLQFINFK